MHAHFIRISPSNVWRTFTRHRICIFLSFTLKVHTYLVKQAFCLLACTKLQKLTRQRCQSHGAKLWNWHVMVHLHLCLPDRCGQKMHKSKGDRQCKIGQIENVCLFCSYVFSVRTSQGSGRQRYKCTIKTMVHYGTCSQDACAARNSN